VHTSRSDARMEDDEGESLAGSLRGRRVMSLLPERHWLVAPSSLWACMIRVTMDAHHLPDARIS
jgi:hypothetical protein